MLLDIFVGMQILVPSGPRSASALHTSLWSTSTPPQILAESCIKDTAGEVGEDVRSRKGDMGNCFSTSKSAPLRAYPATKAYAEINRRIIHVKTNHHLLIDRVGEDIGP